jgi:hypothetical protein
VRFARSVVAVLVLVAVSSLASSCQMSAAAVPAAMAAAPTAQFTPRTAQPIAQPEIVTSTTVLDQADQPISPEVAICCNPRKTCRYILDWRRED